MIIGTVAIVSLYCLMPISARQKHNSLSMGSQSIVYKGTRNFSQYPCIHPSIYLSIYLIIYMSICRSPSSLPPLSLPPSLPCLGTELLEVRQMQSFFRQHEQDWESHQVFNKKARLTSSYRFMVVTRIQEVSIGVHGTSLSISLYQGKEPGSAASSSDRSRAAASNGNRVRQISKDLSTE